MTPSPTSQQHIVIPQDGKPTPLPLTWYHEKNRAKYSFYSRKDNTQVSPLICGSATLPAVANALMAAKSGIEISVWVFDPALTLNGYNRAVTEQCWLGKSIGSASPKIGDLLLAASKRGVKVKLLIWNPGDLLYNILRAKRLAEDLARQYPLETGLAALSAAKLFKNSGDLGKLALLYTVATQQDAINNWYYRLQWYQEVASGNTNIQLRTAGPGLADMGKEILKEALIK